MPNRIIKESVCTSDNLDTLSWFEEVCFYRLIVNCDDYGRLDARLAILRSKLFPLKSITDKQINSALQSLRSAGMIDLYDVDGRSFLQIRTWEKHQTIRAKKSKFPSPEQGLQTSEINCMQMQADVSVIQSNPNPNPNQNTNTNARERADIIDYLNEKVGTNYRADAALAKKHIDARINEGYTVEDFRTVIDKKVAEWKGTEFEKFLRPETLFGTKFDSYLNATNGGGSIPAPPVYTSDGIFEALYADEENGGDTA